MLFHSDEFILLLLPIALCGWFLLSRRAPRHADLVWLLACSLFFYAWWQPALLPLLLASIAVNLLIGRYLARPDFPARRAALVAGIVLNLGTLGYFKYSAFLVQTVNDLLGTSFPAIQPELPLAISFFTFQQVAFLVDAYRSRVSEHGSIDYAVFVSFFPQLIAGPIVHHREFLPQLLRRNQRRVDRDLAVGLTLFSMGLFKKVILADEIGAFVSPVFGAAELGVPVSLVEAWVGTLAFTLQIYFDFSAYSDMALGLARMFGFLLPLNFDSPLKATSISELWRRWHITLSRFLRDYLFTPLGGLSRSLLRRCVAVMTTMVLCGLWHGAGWTFILWGAVQGVLLIVEQLWRVWRRKRTRARREAGGLRLAAQCLLTFLAFSVSLVLFRADSVSAAARLLTTLVGAHGGAVGGLELLQAVGLGYRSAAFWIGAGLLVVWCLPNTQQIMGRFRPAIGYRFRPPASGWRDRLWARWQWRPHWNFALGTALLLGVALSALSKAQKFIYFQF